MIIITVSQYSTKFLDRGHRGAWSQNSRGTIGVQWSVDLRFRLKSEKTTVKRPFKAGWCEGLSSQRWRNDWNNARLTTLQSFAGFLASMWGARHPEWSQSLRPLSTLVDSDIEVTYSQHYLNVLKRKAWFAIGPFYSWLVCILRCPVCLQMHHVAECWKDMESLNNDANSLRWQWLPAS